MNPIRIALRQHRVVVVVSLLLLAAGVHALLTMPRRATPEITIFDGLVIALYPGATAEQVEQQLTRKLEAYLFSKAEVNQANTSSVSRDGLAVVTVQLNEWVESTDTVWSELQIGLAELRLIVLPDGVIGPLVDSDFGDVVALLISAHSPKRSYEELQRALDRVSDEIRSLDATGKVWSFGYRPEKIYVTADSERLAHFAVGLDQVVAVLRTQNVVDFTGALETEHGVIPLHTTGAYSTVEDIRRQRVLTTPFGEVVRIGDVAQIERRRGEPTSTIRINGEDAPAMVLAVEMQPGHNIVDYGKEVQQKLDEVRRWLPPDIEFTTINDQPQVVADSVNDFVREFLIAICAVILVTMVLLPFRVASIAAMAIPVTVAFTFAALDLLGIELHEVSLAALIVVLGMVVDDAIVIADNYVEKLDEGLDRYEAAWRSASELFVPVLTATVAIIAAFVPLAFVLTGAVGEFIVALPITVAISLSASFVVAMLLTPFLCYTFIHTGLKSGEDSDQEAAPHGILGQVQQAYSWILSAAMSRPLLTIAAAVIVIAVGAAMMLLVDEKFFPAAERSQFVIEVEMPLGTPFEVTEGAVRMVEQTLADDERITDIAAFVGASPPRVYYSFAPVFPRPSYALLLVNTVSVKETDKVVADYQKTLLHVVPEADVNVQRFQQGIPVGAPVEVRLVGYEIPVLEELAKQVGGWLRSVPGSRLVRTDFDQGYFVNLRIDDEVAGSLGFTSEAIARRVAVAFEGAPVSRLWDGETAVPIVLRLDDEHRQQFEDLENFTLRSPLTSAAVPLRQMVQLEPRWHNRKISRRNGLRTLTVQAHTEIGVLPADVLAQVKPHLAELDLPPGYRVEIGGEYEGEMQTFAKMAKAVAISGLLVFFILLIQFGNATEPLIVMLAIPLSLFGAVLGLLLSGNPFGFTASVGLISLIGIVIRNSIILVDYGDELVRDHGLAPREAALASGERRMRPIFLTSMAAAVGVVPMIISGSPLWAPLASVFAVGVIFSMVMTLIIVPVVYAQVMSRSPALLAEPEGENP